MFKSILRLASESSIVSAQDFKGMLEKLLKPNGRIVNVNTPKALHTEQMAFVELINLPVGKDGNGAEAVNNRMLFSVSDFSQPKVTVTQLTSNLPREWKLRAKTGTPEQVAKHIATFVNKVVQEVEPRWTHSKVAFIEPYKDDGDHQVKAGLASLKKAIVHAEKAQGLLKTLEKESNAHRKLVLDAIEEFIDVLEKLDQKKVGPFLAKAKSTLPGVRSAKWTEFLAGGGPAFDFTMAVGDLPSKLRAWLTKNKPTLGALEKFYSATMGKVHKSSRALQEEVKGLEPLVDEAWSEAKGTEVLTPAHRTDFDLSDMNAYADIFRDAKAFAEYPMIHMDKAEERFDGFVESLKEMEKLLGSMKNGVKKLR